MKASEAVVLAGERNLLQVDDLSDNLISLKIIWIVWTQNQAVQLLELSRQAWRKDFYWWRIRCSIAGRIQCRDGTYEIEGEIVGTVGVIGPRRMAYERIIPIVELQNSFQQLITALI